MTPLRRGAFDETSARVTMLESLVTAHQREILRRDRLVGTYADLAIRLGLLGLFLYWAAIVIRPFASVIIWSVVLCVALYPVYDWIAERLGGRRRLAAALTSGLTLAIVIGPATWLVLGVIDGVRFFIERYDDATLLPPASEALRQWPFVGEQLYQFWDLAAHNLQAALAKLAPQLRPLGHTFLQLAADAGTGTLKFLVAVVLTGFLFVPAPAFVRTVRSFVRRIDSAHAEHFIKLAGASIRTVAQGVLGISALQALLAGIGLVIADVPMASLITVAVLVFGIIQIGSAVVLVPLIIWSWMTMETPVALAFSVYMGFVSILDNILKPIVMRRGLHTPVPVIIIGLVGGTLSYGITGLFLGPIVLAVIWELAMEWIQVPEEQQSKD